MILMKLYAELQVNPHNIVVYRKLAEHYQSVGMTNEAEAFRELIRRKFNADDPSTNQKQREDSKDGN
jgi:hypothetical protein